MENKSVLKAGAYADAGAGNFHVAGGRNDERFEGGAKARCRSWYGRRDINANDARGYTCILSRGPRPAQRGGYCEKSLTEAAGVVTHCVFHLPLGGSSRRNKED